MRRFIKRFGESILVLIGIVIGSIMMAGVMYYPVKAVKAWTVHTSATTAYNDVSEGGEYIYIPGLAERLTERHTRLYYMAVAEVKDGRARLAREDGQSWTINNHGYEQFEHVLVEIDERGTYEYEDDEIIHVWRFGDC